MSKTATLYRMLSDEHICPFGIKSKDLLERNGFEVEDKPLRSREEIEAFKQREGVDTTPQTYIGGERVGGYDQLRDYFGLGEAEPEGTTYIPVVAIFLTCFLMAVSLSWRFYSGVAIIPIIEIFVALSMCALAIQKLRDLYAFSNQFITYDLLGMRKPGYAYVYPFVEAWAGIGMLAGVSAWLVSPFALFIGVVGGLSVFKAVYIDKRELKCACVGGNSNVPLGVVSLTENLFMIAAAIWMWVK